MERLMEDAINVKNLLPWIESDEDIINFMRKIPLDKSHLRNQLTLHHFIKSKDNQSDSFEKKIEDDARKIVIVVPDTSYKEIKERLTVLGNMPNRKEVVLRQLLHKKQYLDTVLTEINIDFIKKRKSDYNNDVFEFDCKDRQMGIKIKIRKTENSMEVTSISPSPSTSSANIQNVAQLEEQTVSTNSVTSSTSSSGGSPDSTVPSAADFDDPCPEFTAILNNLRKTSSEPSIAESTMPVKASTASAPLNKQLAYGNAREVPTRIPRRVLGPGKKILPKENNIVNGCVSNENNNDKEHEFNLVSFVKELSLAPERKIYQMCKRFNLDLYTRPSEEKLTFLLNHLLDDVVEIESDGSTESDDTQEYDYEDYLPEATTKIRQNNVRNKVNLFEKSFIVNPNGKKFKLKAATLNLEAQKPINLETFTSPDTLPSQTMPVIQPARFNPPSPRENTIPAMPDRYLEMMQPIVPVHKIAGEPMAGPSQEAINLTVKDNRSMEVNEEAKPGPSNRGTEKKRTLDQNLVLRLIEMFPEACPEYVRDICDRRQWGDLDDVVTIILSTPNYPKRPERVPSPTKEVDPEEQNEIIKELLPDADPTYIRMQCERFANDEKGLKEFVNRAMEDKDYPTMKEYLRKQQLSAQQKQYTSEFNMENFIQLFPEPEKTFGDPKRTVKIDQYSAHYVNLFFRNRYEKISAKWIQQVLIQNNFKALMCEKALMAMVRRNDIMKSKRKSSPLPDNLQNIPLLQELAYLSHKEEIKNYLLQKQKREEQERVEAKENGLMETCQCCYDEEVMPKDTFNCPNGCKFCKDCIKKSCEVALGDGKTDFPCLANCSMEFTLQTLQDVLPPKMFSKLAQKKALAEIKAAGIEELETCPFCDFASIPNEVDKIFRCLNPDCMKESCRKCKEPNHVPLKCEEVEKDQDVKARTYIENKMTEALIRKCWKCGTSFFKEEGCNKMTCSCGANMCYICQKPVKDYSHFNGIGGDQYHRCPLYSDTNMVNQENVMNAAVAAKAEVDPSKLKVDPTVGLTDHYKSRGKKLPREPHMEALHLANRMEVLHQHVRHRHHHNHQDPNEGFVMQHDMRILEPHFINPREEIPGILIDRRRQVLQAEHDQLLRQRRVRFQEDFLPMREGLFTIFNQLNRGNPNQ